MANRKRTTKKQSKPKYLASEEFASAAEYFKGEDIQQMRRKLQGKNVSITEMKRVEFDDSDKPVRFMYTKEFEKAFKVNSTNGRNLAEELGEDVLNWSGTVSISAHKHSTGWGVLMSPVLDSDASDNDDDDLIDDDDLPADDDDDLE